MIGLLLGFSYGISLHIIRKFNLKSFKGNVTIGQNSIIPFRIRRTTTKITVSIDRILQLHKDFGTHENIVPLQKWSTQPSDEKLYRLFWDNWPESSNVFRTFRVTNDYPRIPVSILGIRVRDLSIEVKKVGRRNKRSVRIVGLYKKRERGRSWLVRVRWKKMDKNVTDELIRSVLGWR